MWSHLQNSLPLRKRRRLGHSGRIQESGVRAEKPELCNVLVHLYCERKSEIRMSKLFEVNSVLQNLCDASFCD